MSLKVLGGVIGLWHSGGGGRVGGGHYVSSNIVSGRVKGGRVGVHQHREWE